jgi:SAM-dependent methyltransferase
MARAPRGGRRTARLSDILAGQPADEELLAAIYDLEHDEITEDLAFYRRWARRQGGAVLDLGCGSGRLFRALLDGGARRVAGVDGSAALVARAAARGAAGGVRRAPPGDGRL